MQKYQYGGKVVNKLLKGLKKMQPKLDDKRAKEIAESIAYYSYLHNEDPYRMAAMAAQESSLSEDVITGKRKSRAGATGLFQLMPATAKYYKVNPVNIPEATYAATLHTSNIRNKNIKQGYGSGNKAAEQRYNAGGPRFIQMMKGERYMPETAAYSKAIDRRYNTGFDDEEFEGWTYQGTIDPELLSQYSVKAYRDTTPIQRESTSINIPLVPSRKQAGGNIKSGYKDIQYNVLNKKEIMDSYYKGLSKLPLRSVTNLYKVMTNNPDKYHPSVIAAAKKHVYGIGSNPIPPVIEPFKQESSVYNMYKPEINPKFQKGGDVKTNVEIEAGEYVYNPKGVDDISFKMADDTGKKYKSEFGFLVKGKDHKDGGIKVEATDAYIASKYLGINGKKAGKNNKSVADLMINNGGKALSTGSKNKWDRFGINQYNPRSVAHHLRMMDRIKNQAELGKLLNKQERSTRLGTPYITLPVSGNPQEYIKTFS